MKIVRARDTEECPNCGEDLSPVRGGRAPTPGADWWCPSCMRAFDESEINDPMNKEPHKEEPDRITKKIQENIWSLF